MEEDIREFIEDWRERGGFDYLVEDLEVYDETKGEFETVSFEDELRAFMNDEPELREYVYTYCGGYESPGYSTSCYCISAIAKDDKFYTVPVQFETM